MNKVEFGDWQTNDSLALTICKLLYAKGIHPQVVLEPTCGKGSFIKAALRTFDSIEEIIGIEINCDYVGEIKQWIAGSPYKNVKFTIFCDTIFGFDFSKIRDKVEGKNLLILGNPPWVTNSQLGVLESDNLPSKSNLKKVKGIEAMTGKGNFDIAEYITYSLIKAFPWGNVHIAFLIKNSVIKNILQAREVSNLMIGSIEQYSFDAMREFGANVAASLFFAKCAQETSNTCQVFDLYTKEYKNSFGWVNGKFVSNTELYGEVKDLDGQSPFLWRSGVKHDCSKVMEIKRVNDLYYNGLGEIVDVEDDCVYPLVKSSDIKSNVIDSVSRYLIITQRKTSDNTEELKVTHPKLYKYLLQHKEYFDNRRSSIYKNNSRFCLFGIGDYSFKPYKVVISGLYKHIIFAFVDIVGNKPVMADDTCYIIGFDNKEDARFVAKLFNDEKTKKFIRSVSFEDAKRIVNKELLMRIDVGEVAKCSGEMHKSFIERFAVPTLFGNSYLMV